MKTIELTPEEAALVSALLEVYEQCADQISYNHESYCECLFCTAYKKAGNMNWQTFNSLSNKTNP